MFGVGPAMTALTTPSRVGLKAASNAPVVWSKATRPLSGTAVEFPVWVALVNDPPATIHDPVCAMP